MIGRRGVDKKGAGSKHTQVFVDASSFVLENKPGNITEQVEVCHIYASFFSSKLFFRKSTEISSESVENFFPFYASHSLTSLSSF